MKTSGDGPFLVRLTMDLEPRGAEDERILREFGKSADGRHFTRDVMVPGGITLEGLHHVIQEAFGFLDGHLHKFNLPGERLEEICENKAKKFCGFYGVFLHYADDERPMGIPAQNYTGTQRSFLARPPYSGPYERNVREESYGVQQTLLGKVLDSQKVDLDDPEIGSMGIEEFVLKYLRDSFYELKSDLMLSAVLAPEGEKLPSGSEWNDAFDVSKPECFGYLTDRLEYLYDFGDGWRVDITRPAIPEGMEKVARKVERNDSPICVAKSGLMLVDDVGGTFGYTEFLRCVFGEGPSEHFSYDNKDETYRWAHDTFGWTRRNHYPSELFNAKSLW